MTGDHVRAFVAILPAFQFSWWWENLKDPTRMPLSIDGTVVRDRLHLDSPTVPWPSSDQTPAYHPTHLTLKVSATVDLHRKLIWPARNKVTYCCRDGRKEIILWNCHSYWHKKTKRRKPTCVGIESRRSGLTFSVKNTACQCTYAYLSCRCGNRL